MSSVAGLTWPVIAEATVGAYASAAASVAE